MSIRPENCCQLIPPYSFLGSLPDPSQFAAAKLTHYSSKLQRPSDISRPRPRTLFSWDLHPTPDPTTKYTCPLCVRNVISCRVSYLCNPCSGWLHSMSSGLQNTAEYKRIKDLVCSSCSSPLNPLYRNHTHYHHQFQHKLSMGSFSPSCNSTQMA